MESLATSVTAFFLKFGREDLVEHTKEVAGLAKRLAERFDVSGRYACDASWLHDIGRVVSHEDIGDTADNLGIYLLSEERRAPSLAHGKISRALAQTAFGIQDQRVLQAVECHTTLRPQASDLDKVLFLADKLSWNPEDLPCRTEVLALVEVSLDAAVLCLLSWMWDTRNTMVEVHPSFQMAYMEFSDANKRGK